MGNLWWLEPAWKSAVCRCGVNIWDSGGDPDHGVCFQCFEANYREQEAEEELRRLENEEMERHFAKHPHG